jgi:hypothetical protein
MRLSALIALFLAPAVLTPGASEIASDHFHDSREALRMVRDSTIGHVNYEWHMLPNDRLLLVTTALVQGRSVLDSSVVKRHGLAPISEMAQVGNHLDHWTYDGPTVTFTQVTTDSGTSTKTHTYEHPVFDFQELDDLLRSLPLRDGYEKILPLYSEGTDTLEMDTVRITGHSGGTYTLRFADPAIVATYDVDEKTRAIVRHESVGRKSGKLLQYLAEPGN